MFFPYGAWYHAYAHECVLWYILTPRVGGRNKSAPIESSSWPVESPWNNKSAQGELRDISHKVVYFMRDYYIPQWWGNKTVWTRKRDDDNDCRVFRTIVKTWGTTKAKQKVETRSGARGKSRERDCVLDFRETFLIVHIVEPRVPPFPSSWVDLAKEECHVLNLNVNYFQRIHLMAHCLRPRRKREREKEEEENECNDGLSEFTRGVTRFLYARV